MLAIGGDSGGDGGSDFIVLELPRTGRAVCGNKPAVSTACIRPSGLSEGDGSIAAGSPSVIDVIAAGSPSKSREFSAVAGCFLLATRTKQFIFLHSCIILTCPFF